MCFLKNITLHCRMIFVTHYKLANTFKPCSVTATYRVLLWGAAVPCSTGHCAPGLSHYTAAVPAVSGIIIQDCIITHLHCQAPCHRTVSLNTCSIRHNDPGQSHYTPAVPAVPGTTPRDCRYTPAVPGITPRNCVITHLLYLQYQA